METIGSRDNLDLRYLADLAESEIAAVVAVDMPELNHLRQRLLRFCPIQVGGPTGGPKGRSIKMTVLTFWFAV